MRGMLMILACAALLGGCSWVGNTAGKAQAKIEQKVDALEKGYESGYKSENGQSTKAP